MGVKFAVIYKHIPLPLFRYQFAENRKAIQKITLNLDGTIHIPTHAKRNKSVQSFTAMQRTSLWGQHFLRSNFKVNTQKIARDFFKTFRGACVNPKWKTSRTFVDATL